MTEPETRSRRAFDLEQRTAVFGERVIDFAQRIPRNPVNVPLISQIVRAATSIGANYGEADDAESNRDFCHKAAICKKEARETKHWLRMIAKAEPALRDDARLLWQEAKELHLIFAAILRAKKNKGS
jgi:four helix bundle protein